MSKDEYKGLAAAAAAAAAAAGPRPALTRTASSFLEPTPVTKKQKKEEEKPKGVVMLDTKALQKAEAEFDAKCKERLEGVHEWLKEQVDGKDEFNCEQCHKDKKIEDMKDPDALESRHCDECWPKVKREIDDPDAVEMEELAKGEEGTPDSQVCDRCVMLLPTVKVPRSGVYSGVMCNRCRHMCENDDCCEEMEVEPTKEQLVDDKRLCKECLDKACTCSNCDDDTGKVLEEDEDGERLCDKCKYRTCDSCGDVEATEIKMDEDGERLCDNCKGSDDEEEEEEEDSDLEGLSSEERKDIKAWERYKKDKKKERKEKKKDE